MIEMKEIEFTAKIMKTLTENGFPTKRVALPLEKMFESADQKGLSMNTILDKMREDGISCELKSDKIIFSQPKPISDDTPTNKANSSTEFPGLSDDLMSKMGDWIQKKGAGHGPADLMRQTQELMQNLTPNQLQELQNLYMNFTPEERQRMMDLGKGA